MRLGQAVSPQVTYILQTIEVQHEIDCHFSDSLYRSEPPAKCNQQVPSFGSFKSSANGSYFQEPCTKGPKLLPWGWLTCICKVCKKKKQEAGARASFVSALTLDERNVMICTLADAQHAHIHAHAHTHARTSVTAQTPRRIRISLYRSFKKTYHVHDVF